MRKKLWGAYFDFLTFGWVSWLNAKLQMRLLAAVVLCIAASFLAEGVGSLQPGAHATTKDGLPMSREFTIAWAIVILLFSAPTALVALCALVEPGSVFLLEQISLVRWPVAFLRFSREYRRNSDPWLSARCGAAHKLFGLGSNHPFAWYLTGKSSYLAGNLEGVCSFLRRCEYMSDEEQFDSWDLWQHPIDFEKRMCGDCEDHALWAWRKLRDLGIDAEFVCGRHISPRHPEPGSGHSWVVVRTKDGTLLLESTAKSSKPMLLPLADAKATYIPWFSVNGKCQMRVHGGYLAEMHRRNTKVPLD